MAGLAATVQATRVGSLPRALALAKAGCVAPASSRNWNRDGARVQLADNVMPEMRALLTDPATSGALLIACKPESVDRVLKLCRLENGIDARVIGSLAASAVDAGRPTAATRADARPHRRRPAPRVGVRSGITGSRVAVPAGLR